MNSQEEPQEERRRSRGGDDKAAEENMFVGSIFALLEKYDVCFASGVRCCKWSDPLLACQIHRRCLGSYVRLQIRCTMKK